MNTLKIKENVMTQQLTKWILGILVLALIFPACSSKGNNSTDRGTDLDKEPSIEKPIIDGSQLKFLNNLPPIHDDSRVP